MEGLLIAGRGINSKDGVFAPTALLEVLAPSREHQLVQQPVDDFNPLCYIGGGNFNVRAGVEIYDRLRPRLVAFAYGNTRTQAFKDADAPFEGPVMEEMFLHLLHEKGIAPPQTLTWTVNEEELCNSQREIRQFMELAIERRMGSIGIVTVAVHMLRIQVFVALLKQEKHFAHIDVQFFVSEVELLAANWPMYSPFVAAELASHAFKRNAADELAGTCKAVAGTYTFDKPPIAAGA
jgi:hypothetical protein